MPTPYYNGERVHNLPVYRAEVLRLLEGINGGGGGGTSATEATLQQLLTAVNNVSIDADTINVSTDGVEAALNTILTTLSALNTNTDQIEPKLTDIRSELTTIGGFTDGLETSLLTLSGQLPSALITGKLAVSDPDLAVLLQAVRDRLPTTLLSGKLAVSDPDLTVLLQAVRDRLPTTLLSGNLRVTDSDAVNLLGSVLGQLGAMSGQLSTIERLLKPPLAGKGFVFSLDVNPQTVYGHDDNRRKTWAFNNSPESTVYFSYDGQFNPPNRVELHDVLAPMERKELLSPISELVFVAEDPTGQPPQGILNVVEFF